MSTTMTLAFVLHLASVLTVTAFGLTYLLRRRFMPYHAVALGCSWESLPPAHRVLILALMRGAGGALLAVAFLQAALLLAPFRSGEIWALWAIPAGALLVSTGALYAMQTVANNTPARPPRGLVLGGTACSLAGFALSLAG